VQAAMDEFCKIRIIITFRCHDVIKSSKNVAFLFEKVAFFMSFFSTKRPLEVGQMYVLRK
jgi:hypothetical protein